MVLVKLKQLLIYPATSERQEATDGTQWKLEKRVVRIPYVGVDQENLSDFLK